MVPPFISVKHNNLISWQELGAMKREYFRFPAVMDLPWSWIGVKISEGTGRSGLPYTEFGYAPYKIAVSVLELRAEDGVPLDD